MKTRDGGYTSPDKRFGSGGSKQRKKNTFDSGKGVKKKGEGLGTGPVGANGTAQKSGIMVSEEEAKKALDKKNAVSPSAPSKESVKRVGEVFQEGAKWLGKAYNDPVGTIKSGVKAAGNAVNDLAKTARKNGYGPKTTATYVADEPGRKGQTMNISSSVKMRVGGAGMDAGGKAVKRDANAAKDNLSRKTGSAQNTGTKKDTLSASKNTGTKKDTFSAPANTGTNKDTKTSAPSASTGKGGFMSKVKSNVSSKDRINAALNYVGGKKTAKADTAKATAKTEKSNKQKAKKSKAATVKSETISGPFNATEAMKQRRAAAEAAGKGKFNATEEMKKRRAAAEAAGKGKFNATEEMKKRRAAAEAQGKGKWNAQEEMRKRREAAQSKKRIQQGFNK